MIDYDSIASEYSRHRQVHSGVVRDLLLTGGVGSTARVLEVGCGTGHYIITLESLVGCLSWGIDLSGQMLLRAREQSERIRFTLGRADRLTFRQGSFDLVFSVDVIHHLSNQLEHFREVYRVLEAKGRVCTVTDSEWIIGHRQPLAVYFPETVQADLGRYPPLPSLRKGMEQAGFGEISQTMVEYFSQLTDARAYRDKAFSCLQLIGKEAFQRGIDRMEQDLYAGPIPCVSRYLLIWGTK